MNDASQQIQARPAIKHIEGEPVLPVKPGDWVANKDDLSRVATVKNVYVLQNEVLVDLVIFSRKGDRVGRESPVCGGPRTFEPACSYENWRRIDRPVFPINLRWVTDEDGRRTARYDSLAKLLPDREWVGPRHQRRPIAIAPSEALKVSDFNPELEASSRRMAAQELRDVARSLGVPALVTRAEELEREADELLGHGSSARTSH